MCVIDICQIIEESFKSKGNIEELLCTIFNEFLMKLHITPAKICLNMN